MRSARLLAAALVALALALTLTACNHSGSYVDGWYSPPSVSPPPACQPDPAEQIAALPAGGTFYGSGCYNTRGILVTRDNVTISGGTYESSNSHAPVIDVRHATGDTIQNVHIIGSDATGSYQPAKVYQAGVELQSTTKTTVTNVTTLDTYGDGLELWTDEPVTGKNVGQLTVAGLTVSRAGRTCVSFGFVYNANLTGVNCASQATDAFDFESDTPGIGSGYVRLSNSSGRYLNFNETILGPITFSNDAFSEILWDDSPANGYPVTINDSSISLVRTPHGTPPGAISVTNHADLVLNNVAITRTWPLGSTLPLSGLSYYVGGVSSLTLHASPITGPPGRVDPSSTLVSSLASKDNPLT